MFMQCIINFPVCNLHLVIIVYYDTQASVVYLPTVTQNLDETTNISISYF